MDISNVRIPNIEKIKLPLMIKIRQQISNIYIQDIPTTVKEQVSSIKSRNKIKKGFKVAITAGSRGIDRMAEVIRAIVVEVKSLGGEPFIIPAMGSHGGGEAKNQTEVLKTYGITEENIGAPIISSMKVVKIGTTKSDIPVYIDEHAMSADGIIVINRVKVHTDFSGEIESGLMKMMAIGLGKHKGASTIHGYEFDKFHKVIPEVGLKILEKAPILFGIVLLENAFGKLCEIAAIDPENFLIKEKEFLKKQKKSMPEIPFNQIDILLIDEMGKDISGSGMDPNIIGRSKNINKDIKIIIPLDLTKKTHGNASGIGHADITTEKLAKKIDFNATYTNGLTSGAYWTIKLPVVLKNDEFAIKAAMKMLHKDSDNIKMVRIKNTLKIDEMEISTKLLEEAQTNKKLSILGEPIRLKADVKGNLIEYPYIN